MKDIFSVLRAIFQNTNAPKNVADNQVDFWNYGDIQLIAGNKTLILTYNRYKAGLHSCAIYDYCHTSDKEGHRLMKEMINKNLEEAYNSLLFNVRENLYWLNIADATNRSAATDSMCRCLYNDMIDVFSAIILKFVKDNVLDNKVGIMAWIYGIGTSVSIPFLCNLIKQNGYEIYAAMFQPAFEMQFAGEKLSTGILSYIEENCHLNIIRIKEGWSLVDLINNSGKQEIIDEVFGRGQK